MAVNFSSTNFSNNCRFMRGLVPFHKIKLSFSCSSTIFLIFLSLNPKYSAASWTDNVYFFQIGITQLILSSCSVISIKITLLNIKGRSHYNLCHQFLLLINYCLSVYYLLSICTISLLTITIFSKNLFTQKYLLPLWKTNKK